MARFLLGGYTADMDGHASGIGMLVAGAPDEASAGGPLGFAGEVAAANSPSWLTPHPTLDVVYAALEGTGAVQAFRRTGETTYALLGAAVEAGSLPCHIEVTPDRSAIVVSCWGDGRVVRMALDTAGRPHSPVVLPASVDPYGPDAPQALDAPDLDLAAAARALREAAGEEYAHLVPAHDETPVEPAEAASDARPAHAHQVKNVGSGVLASTDMGFDLVRFWLGDRAGQQLALPRGTGPRHMVWHPSGHLYVVTELSREVYVLRWDPTPGASSIGSRGGQAWGWGGGAWRIVSACSLGPTLDGDYAAELAVSHDGAFLYAGVRGSNTIATLRVRGAGESLEQVALVDAGVNWPRHHLVQRDTLLVAGQLGDEVASLSLDIRTGVPGKVRHRTAAPSPTCILPLR